MSRAGRIGSISKNCASRKDCSLIGTWAVQSDHLPFSGLTDCHPGALVGRRGRESWAGLGSRRKGRYSVYYKGYYLRHTPDPALKQKRERLFQSVTGFKTQTIIQHDEILRIKISL